jgi:hypothetical protein
MRTTVRTSRNSAVTLGPVGFLILLPFVLLWLILAGTVGFVRLLGAVCVGSFHVIATVWRDLVAAERALRGWLARP